MSAADPLPTFKYHPDPLASGSVVRSDAACRCCGKSRGYIYAGPVYGEEDDLDDALCPWCIADGTAAQKFDATFVDAAAFGGDVPEATVTVISERTPGFSSWQSEQWPSCCGDATAFQEPLGIADIRAKHRELEMVTLSHIIYELGISGGAATRLLESLHRDHGPTAFAFRCLGCGEAKVYVDHH